MEISAIEDLPVEMLDIITSMLDPEDWLALRMTCKTLNACTVDNVAKFYFSKISSSLMGSSLQRLEGIATHSVFRKSLKTLIIEDKSYRVDPYNDCNHASSTEIWPRDDTGHVVSDRIGVQSLQKMLRMREITPTNIRVRGYQISQHNLTACSEFVQWQYKSSSATNWLHLLRITNRFARDVFDGTKVTIRCIFQQSILDEGMLEVNRTRFTEPERCEIDFRLLCLHPQTDDELSALSIAVIIEGAHWIDRVLNAPQMTQLSLLLVPREMIERITTEFHGKLTRLRSLHLSHVTITPVDIAYLIGSLRLTDLTISCGQVETIQSHLAEDCEAISEPFDQYDEDKSRGLLEKTKSTVKSITLDYLGLGEGLSWRSLLTFLSHTIPALDKFQLETLEHPDGVFDDDFEDIVCFDILGRDMIPSECTGELVTDIDSYDEVCGGRFTTVDYKGPSADLALRHLADYIVG